MEDPLAWCEPAALNLADALAASAKQSGYRFEAWDDVWVADRELPLALANFVILVRPLLPDSVEGLTARVRAFFQESGSPWMLWSAWPTPDLAQFGYQLSGKPPHMVALPGQLNVPPATDLEIRRVTSAPELEVYERAFLEGYGFPDDIPYRPGILFGAGTLAGPVEFLAGYVGDRMVSVSAACTGHGVRGIYNVATLADARGNGYGSAMTVAAAGDSDLPLVLQSSDAGFPIYQKLGFKEVGRFSLWVGPGS